MLVQLILFVLFLFFVSVFVCGGVGVFVWIVFWGVCFLGCLLGCGWGVCLFLLVTF